MSLPKPDPKFEPRRFVAAAMLATLLSACAVSTPVSIESTGVLAAEGNSVELAPFEADESLRGEFGAALSEAFAAHSIATRTPAPVIAEFAIAARNAEAGVADPAASGADGVDWQSRPRDRGMFDQCDAVRLRATLVLLDRAEGTILYRGVGEKNGCNYGQADLAELANALVADSRVTPSRP